MDRNKLADKADNLSLLGVWMVILAVFIIFAFAVFAPTSDVAPYLIFPLIFGGILLAVFGVVVGTLL